MSEKPAQLQYCPRCGARPWYESGMNDDHDDDQVYTYIECSKCRAKTKLFVESEDAEKAWNEGELV